jgi:hypothetical protein
MKRLFLIGIAFGLILSACLPAFPQPQNDTAPVSDEDLRLTAAVLSEQTLQALPTQLPLPSETPVVLASTSTTTQPTPTETVNPVLLTLTATLLAGTPTAGTQIATSGTAGIAGSETPAAGSQNTPVSGPPQPGFSGTLPPFLPSGTVQFFNKADVDVYISLRCVTKEGYVTILEYPVKKNFSTSAPAGTYTYVAWVGGRQFDGGFKMDKDGFVTITFFKNRITVKKE